MKIIATAMMLLLVSPVSAQLYKCKDNGKTIYQQIPCMKGEQKVILKDRQPTPNGAIVIPAGAEYREGILLGSFSIKVTPADAEDYTALSYKVDVKNLNTVDEEVHLKYNALAADGFLINQAFIRGIIPALSHKELVGKVFFSNDEYNTIARWELDVSDKWRGTSEDQ